MSKSGFAQTDSTYWYVNGQANWWYYQIDMFSFRCSNGLDYTGTIDTAITQLKLYHADRRDLAVELYFKPTATPQEKWQQISDIFDSGELESVYPVITRNPIQLHVAQDWYLIDDLILVRFVDKHEDSTDIADFMHRYSLTLHNAPSPNLPYDGHYTYIFKLPFISEPDSFNVIDFGRLIYENETGFVENVSPNIVNYAKAHHDDNTSPISEDSVAGANNVNSLSCSTLNDHVSPNPNAPNPYGASELDNPGFTTAMFSGTSVTAIADADADICECWDMGYTGQRIRVAVMGDGFFISNHPDMIGATIGLTYDCSSGVCIPFNSTVIPNTPPYTQGVLHLASSIVSQPNNGTGISGVAPNTKLGIFTTSDYEGTSSTAAIVAALQEIPNDHNMDITVTDIVSKVNQIDVSAAVDNLLLLGRPNPTPNSNGYFPMAVIASAGNEGFDHPATIDNRYPAAYPGVIGVITSTPADLRKMEGDGWATVSSATNEDANYGLQYDVAAPGTAIWTNHVTNIPVGPPSYVSSPPIGQEVAPGIVAGIVAMMLEKNYYLNNLQIIAALRGGADKVSYNYIGGLSIEFAYGRVSCDQTLGMLYTTNIVGNVANKIDSYTAAGILFVTIPSELQHKTLHLQVVDMLGRTVVAQDFQSAEKEYTLPIKALSKGVYALSITQSNSLFYTHKVAIYE